MTVLGWVRHGQASLGPAWQSWRALVGTGRAWPGNAPRNVHRPEVESPGGGNDLTASGHQETT